jgi:putative membrane protein
MLQAYAYAIHLLSGFVLLGVFFGIYTKVITPFDELALIKQGNIAAAMSLAGALLGFSLTLWSSILHNDTFYMFLAWGIGAMIVQAVCYVVMARSLPEMERAIEGNNVAVGALMGTASLSIGMINAACIS